MADLEKTVSIIFAGVDNLSGTASQINRSFSDLGGSISSVADPLAGIAESVLKAEAALAALAVGGLALAVKTAGDFNASFNEVNTMAGTTGASMDQFREDILNYATGSTQSIEDITTATYNAISMGVSWENSLATLETAEKLAAAGKAELNSTLELLVGTMNAYGASSDETARYADAFFTIVKDGKTTIPELAASMSQVSAISASAGIDIETLGAALAAVTAAGVPTSQAITGLKAAISNIIKPSEQAKDMASALGIQFDAAALKTYNLDGMMRLVYEATGGNIDQMGKLFGSVEGLNIAMIAGADKSGILAKALTDMANKTGVVNTAFEQMKDNMGLTLTNLVNNIKAVLVDAGTPLLAEFGESVSAMATVLQGVRIGIDNGAFDPFFAAINEAQNELQAWLKGVAEAMPEAMAGVDFSALINEIQGLGGEIGEVIDTLFGEFDLTKPEELEAAIQKVVDVITNLTATARGVLDGMEPLFSAIGLGITKFSELDVETAKLGGTVAGVGKTVSEFVDALEKIGPALNVLTYGTIVSATANVLNLVGGLAALGPIAIPAGIAAGILAIGYAGAYALNEIVQFVAGINDIPHEIDTKLTLESGDVVDLVTGYIRDTNGKIVDVPTTMELENGDTINTVTGYITDANGKQVQVRSEVVLENGDTLDLINGFITEAESGKTYDLRTKITIDKTTDERVVEAIQSGESQLVIDYMLNPSTENLEKALAETGALVKRTVEEEVKGPILETLEWIDEEGQRHELKVPVDNTDIEKTKAAIEAVPTEKMLEIKLQGEVDERLAQIKADADILQTAMEWTAKLDIAKVEASLKMFEASIGSVNTGIESTGQTLTSLFGMLEEGGYGNYKLERAIDKEMEYRAQEFELQKRLLEQQIEINKEKLDAMKDGESLISISAEGLEPELEAFMWKIIERVQVRATEEASEFLLGI